MNPSLLFALALSWYVQDGRFVSCLYPFAEIGVPVNRAGIASITSYSADLEAPLPGILGFGFRYTGFASFMGHLSGYGIPGPGITGVVGAEVQAGIGPPASSVGDGTRFFNGSYAVQGYLASDGTSQLTGSVGLEFAIPGHRVVLDFENDVFVKYVFNGDQFRTGALSLGYWWHEDSVWSSVSLGCKIWTGQKKGLPRPAEGEAYDLSGRFGGSFSNGILFLAFRRGPYEVGLGWDSETIRDAIQNRFHDLVGSPRIAMNGREDRLSLSFSINPPPFLY